MPTAPIFALVQPECNNIRSKILYALVCLKSCHLCQIDFALKKGKLNEIDGINIGTPAWNPLVSTVCADVDDACATEGVVEGGGGSILPCSSRTLNTLCINTVHATKLVWGGETGVFTPRGSHRQRACPTVRHRKCFPGFTATKYLPVDAVPAVLVSPTPLPAGMKTSHFTLKVLFFFKLIVALTVTESSSNSLASTGSTTTTGAATSVSCSARGSDCPQEPRCPSGPSVPPGGAVVSCCHSPPKVSCAFRKQRMELLRPACRQPQHSQVGWGRFRGITPPALTSGRGTNASRYLLRH